MTIDKVTPEVTYQGFTLQELAEINRRYQLALEMAAKENQLIKAALDLVLELNGHKSDCDRCESGFECAVAEGLDQRLDEARLELYRFYQGNS
jgi:hypothetical protein